MCFCWLFSFPPKTLPICSHRPPFCLNLLFFNLCLSPFLPVKLVLLSQLFIAGDNVKSLLITQMEAMSYRRTGAFLCHAEFGWSLEVVLEPVDCDVWPENGISLLVRFFEIILASALPHLCSSQLCPILSYFYSL